MKPVTATELVDRPAEQVFAVVSDVANNPRWQRGMRSCVWTSRPPHEAGATYDQTAHFLGKDVVSTFAVTALEPGRRITVASTSGPFPIVETRVVQPVSDDRCVVCVVVEGHGSAYFRIAEPLLRGFVRRSVRGDYARLRRMLHAGELVASGREH